MLHLLFFNWYTQSDIKALHDSLKRKSYKLPQVSVHNLMLASYPLKI